MTVRFHKLLTVKQEAAAGLLREGSQASSAPKQPVSAESLRKPADEFCRAELAKWLWADKLTPATRGGLTVAELKNIQSLINYYRSENDWWECGRPYFNVWPVLYGLIESLNLDVEWTRIHMPYKALCMCFPVGKEPLGIACCLAVSVNGGLYLRFQSAIDSTAGGINGYYPKTPQATVAATLSAMPEPVHTGAASLRDAEIFSEERSAFLLRLAVFISVLTQKDREKLLTPILLQKDVERFKETQDEALKQAMIERASRIQGAGFDLGRTQQESCDRHAVSPHVRRAHWQRYWVGPGRQELSVKWIDEIYVLAGNLVEVPTGMLGPESPEECRAFQNMHVRTPIAKRLRFLILRRDEYRCQLCGRKGTDGVPLEIDHKMPVSKGGATVENNLWVLCEDCNRGRSNLPLELPGEPAGSSGE